MIIFSFSELSFLQNTVCLTCMIEKRKGLITLLKVSHFQKEIWINLLKFSPPQCPSAAMLTSKGNCNDKLRQFMKRGVLGNGDPSDLRKGRTSAVHSASIYCLSSEVLSAVLAAGDQKGGPGS